MNRTREEYFIIKEKIKDFLKKELSSDDDFDTWHRDTCDMIKNEAEKYLIKDENEKLFKSFSYGLTQKWLNMTLKTCVCMDGSGKRK